MSRSALGVVSVVLLLCAVLTSTSARAYNNYDNVPCQWTSYQTQVLYWWGPNLVGSSTYDWRVKFNTSTSDWNAAVVGPKYSENSGAANLLDSYSAADGNYGYTAIYCSGGQIDHFNAYANSYYGPSYNWDANWMRSITGHELGHGLALGHSTVSPALMNTSRDRSTVYTPQLDDQSGILALYPHPCPC